MADSRAGAGGARTTLRERLDPTRPARWDGVRTRRARTSFLLRYGVGVCGIAAALLFDAYALTRRREWGEFFTRRHAAQLEVAVALLAPTIGALAGAALLRLGDRRARDARLTAEFKL